MQLFFTGAGRYYQFAETFDADSVRPSPPSHPAPSAQPTNAGCIAHLLKGRHGCRHIRQMLSTAAILLSMGGSEKIFLDALDNRITTGHKEQYLKINDHRHKISQTY